MTVRFRVELARVARSRLVDRRVEPRWRKFPAFPHEFPRPLDRFLFEVIAEAPVPEHLKKREVVGVESDIIEIIMFAAGADRDFFVRVGGGGATRLHYVSR